MPNALFLRNGDLNSFSLLPFSNAFDCVLVLVPCFLLFSSCYLNLRFIYWHKRMCHETSLKGNAMGVGTVFSFFFATAYYYRPTKIAKNCTRHEKHG